MGLKAILFDGYGTLFEDAMQPLMALCAQIAREQGLRMDGDGFLNVWDVHYFPLLHGEDFFTMREAHIISLTRVFRELEIEEDPRHYITPLFDRFGMSPVYDDVAPALAGLAGYATGIVSNADTDHVERALERNGLRFPVVVTSESARSYKPNPAIFHHALDLVNYRAEEALYVGDSQDDDIVGAGRAGMPVAWLNRNGGVLKPGIPKPDYEITGLMDLLEIVRETGDRSI